MSMICSDFQFYVNEFFSDDASEKNIVKSQKKPQPSGTKQGPSDKERSNTSMIIQPYWINQIRPRVFVIHNAINITLESTIVKWQIDKFEKRNDNSNKKHLIVKHFPSMTRGPLAWS